MMQQVVCSRLCSKCMLGKFDDGMCHPASFPWLQSLPTAMAIYTSDPPEATLGLRICFSESEESLP